MHRYIQEETARFEAIRARIAVRPASLVDGQGLVAADIQHETRTCLFMSEPERLDIGKSNYSLLRHDKVEATQPCFEQRRYSTKLKRRKRPFPSTLGGLGLLP